MIPLTKKVLELIGWGYDVTRYHTMPNLRPQNLASHSWAVAMMVMSLFKGTPDEKLLLVQAALEHDLVEKHVGDMPRPGRTDEHRRLEAAKADEHGTFHESLLPPSLQSWLEWADLIEAGLQAQREFDLGNSRYFEVVQRVRGYIMEQRDEVPVILYDLAIEANLAFTTPEGEEDI
jgi:5'-deoxynucleotidase YfbR-like HD superfamily hydrolase